MATEQKPPAAQQPQPQIGNTQKVTREATFPSDFTVLNRENAASLLDIDTSTLDPAFKYRWVNKTGTKFSRAKMRGYVVVDPSKEEVRTTAGAEPDVGPDGVYQCSDVVLMKIPRSKYKARRALVRERTESRLKSAKKKAKKSLRRLKPGVQLTEGDD